MSRNLNWIAITNQKGGVAKTTTAVNLGAGLAQKGRRVLVIDADPQGNASTGLGVDGDNRENNLYDLLCEATPPEKAIRKTAIKNLDIICATTDLAAIEVELAGEAMREYRLREAMDTGAMARYDYVLIDCPPSLGLLTVNALAVAGSVLVPLQCEYYALEGLSHLIRTIEAVRNNINPGLAVRGVVLTMYDGRNNLSRQVAEDVRDHLGDKVYKTMIPRNVRISEAPSFGKPVVVYAGNSRGAAAYRALTDEIMAEG